ncbi:MAG: metallophosphoesterase, partial [Massilia sp.]
AASTNTTAATIAATTSIAPIAASAVTVYAAGDIAQCGRSGAAWSGAAATADLVAAGLAADPQAVALVLGDVAYPRGTQADFATCYEPTWGRFKARTLPAPGNHEYATAGAAGYFGYFGAAAQQGYYSVQLGSWRLISLDSNLAPPAQAAQLAWLEADLAAHPSACTLAYWHHPLYSSGGHGNVDIMRAAWRLLQRAGAELVLSGHDHDYERFAPQDADGNADPARGVRQFVVGTGGAFLTPFLRLRAHSEWRDNSRTGVLKLQLDEGRYRWEFLEAHYDGFANGPAPDRGSGVCH